MRPTRATHVNFPKNAEHVRAPPAAPPAHQAVYCSTLQMTGSQSIAEETDASMPCPNLWRNRVQEAPTCPPPSEQRATGFLRSTFLERKLHTRIECTGESSRKFAPIPGWALGLQYIEIHSSPRTSPNLPLRYSEHGNDLHRLPNNQSRKAIRALDET